MIRGALIALVSLGLPSLASAQTATPHPRPARVRPFRVHPAIDGPVIALAGGTWVATQLTLDRLVTPTCTCLPSELPPIDRWLAGHRNDGVAIAADLTLAVGAGGFVSLLVADLALSHHVWPEIVEDLTIVAEAVLLSGVTNQVTKLVARRPRPMIYGLTAGDPALSVLDNYLSFYSSHTSITFAAGMAVATIYARRHPHDPARWAVYAGAAALGSTVGALRIGSGRHFPTDVLVGAVLGTLAGVLVPLAHARPGFPALSASFDDTGGVLFARWGLP